MMFLGLRMRGTSSIYPITHFHINMSSLSRIDDMFMSLLLAARYVQRNTQTLVTSGNIRGCAPRGLQILRRNEIGTEAWKIECTFSDFKRMIGNTEVSGTEADGRRDVLEGADAQSTQGIREGIQAWLELPNTVLNRSCAFLFKSSPFFS